MARYTGPDCRLCRRERQKLYLKGIKCDSPKCPVERRPYPPGENGRGRIKESEYLLQLREKQKTRRIYGVLEKQFRNYYEEATRKEGLTGENLLQLLELRLDNVLYRTGLVRSRDEARQVIRHRHLTVNGKVVTIPSYRVRVGDELQIVAKAKDIQPVMGALEIFGRRIVPNWLSTDTEARKGTVQSLPVRSQIDVPVQEQMIVELYSK
jgi:small subunit ribosomal protein S4